MILGIDVGGTHTDAVLIEGFQIVKKSKVLTNSNNLLDSLIEATAGNLLRDIPPEKLSRVVLSTTISTNAIVQKKTARVGMIVTTGPGLPPSLLPQHPDTLFVSGYINHRGVEMAGLDREEIMAAAEAFSRSGIDHVGIAGKFSTRNPSHELAPHVPLEPVYQGVTCCLT